MMKKLSLILVIAVVALFSSCNKNDSGITTTDSDVIYLSIDVSDFSKAAELMVYLVPSERAEAAIMIDAPQVGLNEIHLTSDERSSLQADAYFTVILFDQSGKYLTQNFFPYNKGKTNILKLAGAKN